MIVERRADNPYFSVCIPQYNRTPFLLECLRSLEAQSFRDFEVCVSDDFSNDGRDAEVRAFLESSCLCYRYRRLEKNVRYDANLRASLALAQGKYCLLMGNDDALKDEALQTMRDEIGRCERGPGAAIFNYEEYDGGRPTRRVRGGTFLGGGPRTAVRHFRDVSFVSGVVLEREPAQAFATEAWDGSEMYQMYLFSRIVAAGRPLLLSETVAVRRGIRVPGQQVDSYASRPRRAVRIGDEVTLPFHRIGALVIAAVAAEVDPREAASLKRSVLSQWIGFTYGFWIVEYRRVQSWRYAAAFCKGMRPFVTVVPHGLGRVSELALRALYVAVTFAGLTVPLGVFAAVRPFLHAAARRAGRPR